MKKKRTSISVRSIALLMALVLVVGIAFVVPSRAADTASLGKLVDHFQANSSTFTLNGNSRFFLASEPTGELLQTIQLAQRQFAADGIPTSEPMDIVWGDTAMLRSGDIYIKMVTDDSNIGAEGYKIVAESYATVTAEDVDGLLYGLNMLQKHFRAAGSTYSIKGFTTYDTPDTAERTVQLDCARKYLTVEYVCNFIKEMSWMGYNTLQLHLSEDGGYRADLWDETYYVEGEYEPENDFTWLCGSQVQSWVKDETSNGGKNYRSDPDAGKYLTTAELIEIFNVCKEYHIDVIPSFDSPAHMDYLTWKFEQNYLSNTSYSFTYNGETFYAADTSGCINYSNTTGGSTPTLPYYTTMDIRDTTTRGKMSQAFVLSIYKDMADFFRYYAGSTKFNIGADEVNLTNSNIKSNAWSYDLLPGYINEVNALLNAKGYTCRMFNDFITADALEELDDNIEILVWNSSYNSISGTSGYYDVSYKNSSGSTATEEMLTVSDYVSDGRTLYNCINIHTYYVLRVVSGNTGDARSTSCYNWEFYAADEESIYNLWTPNNIRKDGKYTESDAIVSDDQLGGAYFLTWHDYAAVNTETEMWNGVEDFVLENGEFYSVRERMWSNTIKMWNWDINNSLTFANYETIRDLLGDFPGLEDDTYSDASYAKATSLPDATDPIQLSDHTTLTAAIATKIAKGSYTDESYAVYEAAYNEAVLINNNNSATAEELGAALDKLNAAIDQLAIKTHSVTVTRRTTINGTTYVIDSTTYYVPQGESRYTIYIPALTGYEYLRTDAATFTPTENGDGSGYLSGSISSDTEIGMWYENNVDVSRLNTLIADAITEQGSYTDASWHVYANALAAAQEFSLEVDTQQAAVTALVKALESARTALVVNSSETFIKAEKVASSYLEGSQVGLYIYTSSNIPTLVFSVDGSVVTPDSITGEVQTLTTGETVKYWLVFLPAEEAGTYTYTITYGTTSTDITVTVA